MEAVVAVVGLLSFVVFAAFLLWPFICLLALVADTPHIGVRESLALSVSLPFLFVLALYFMPPSGFSQPPLHCWDTDATGLCTVLKDINRDGFCNDRDCPFSCCDCR